MKFEGDARPLALEDFRRAAGRLQCEVAAIQAVAKVESGGKSGFLRNKRPIILFESRWFHVFTHGRFDKSHPHLSTPTWVRNYEGGTREYDDFLEAFGLAPNSAINATSWGMFQVMGFHHKMLGHADPVSFVEAMKVSEGRHLDAFVGFIEHESLADELRDKRWSDFAYVYNGPGFKKNRYDERMAQAYARYKAEGSTQ